MSNANACGKKLTSLLKKLPTSEPPVFPDADDPVAVLLMSFLLWETTTEKALGAYQKIVDQIVDFNDLRVCMPLEVMEMIGVRYPKAQERCERIRASLRDIFLREHTVNLDSLKSMGKREIKKYIDLLNGMTPYVSNRVQLLSYEVHGIPVDEQLFLALVSEGVADSGQSVTDLSNWLARQIKSEDGLKTHIAFQQWVESDRGKSQSASKTASKSGSKKTTRKSAKSGHSTKTKKKSTTTSSS
ncbi:MAG: hypothetical protein O7G85_16370 [Planctomycetota bacterium]|nr:hypothetical protein [Planctomycetota bacterium]